MAKKRESDSLSNFDIANFLHSKRSPKAIAVDNGTSARLTKNLGAWVEQPNRLDFEGVDTVRGRKKSAIKPRAKGAIKKRFGVTIG